MAAITVNDIAGVNTSAQWSTAEAIASKLRRASAGHPVAALDVAGVVRGLPAADLAAAGVWTFDFGAKFQPLVVTNRACAKAREAVAAAGPAAPRCTCGTGDAAADASAQGKVKNYFGSTDYNAGRHEQTSSLHRANCAMWEPSSSSHLHSWRRGF
jgi:hypothetical protein